jgi:23S rRNA pseudouridine2605 synthase
MAPAAAGNVRLQKALAAAGIGSRRACEQLIADGQVTVDGVGVAELGMRVDPASAVIRVKGRRVNVRSDLIYLALNKPVGVLSAMSDPRGRRTLADLLTRPGLPPAERLFHVGRLDADTEGLLILTNDGEFAHRLAHPSRGVVKVYVAEVAGRLVSATERLLRSGIELADGPVRLDGFRILQAGGERTLVEVSLHEGRNHIVRRLLESVGHPVRRLVRIAVGPVRLGDLRSGASRELTPAELSALYREIDLER